MKFSRKAKSQGFDLNLTPLIDVALLLLIFFMVSTTFLVPGSIDVNLPKAKGDTTAVQKTVRVSVTSDGSIYVEGKKYADEQVTDVLSGIKESSPEATVVIEADKASTHGKVIFVMDVARKNGFERFAIAVEQE